MAERNLALLLHHLEGQNDISGFILYLPLKLDFRVMTENKQCCAGERGDDKDKRRQQFSTEFQNAGLSGLGAPQN